MAVVAWSTGAAPAPPPELVGVEAPSSRGPGDVGGAARRAPAMRRRASVVPLGGGATATVARGRWWRGQATGGAPCGGRLAVSCMAARGAGREREAREGADRAQRAGRAARARRGARRSCLDQRRPREAARLRGSRARLRSGTTARAASSTSSGSPRCCACFRFRRACRGREIRRPSCRPRASRSGRRRPRRRGRCRTRFRGGGDRTPTTAGSTRGRRGRGLRDRAGRRAPIRRSGRGWC